MTKMQGGKAFNVIPPAASVGMNLRLLGKDTVESAKAYLEKTINNPKIEVSVFEGRNPSAESDTDCKEYIRLCQAVKDTWTDAIDRLALPDDGMQRFLALLPDHGPCI